MSTGSYDNNRENRSTARPVVPTQDALGEQQKNRHIVRPETRVVDAHDLANVAVADAAHLDI